MAKYALSNMDSNLMDWVMHYIGTLLLKLAPSWGSWVIFHSEDVQSLTPRQAVHKGQQSYFGSLGH